MHEKELCYLPFLYVPVLAARRLLSVELIPPFIYQFQTNQKLAFKE